MTDRDTTINVVYVYILSCQMVDRYSKSLDAIFLHWCVQRGVAFVDECFEDCNGFVDFEEMFEWELHPKDKALIDAKGK